MYDMNEKHKDLFVRKSSRTAVSYLRRIRELSDDIKALSPFLDVLKKVYVDFEPVHNDNDILIGTLCAMIPGELIYAAGAKPVRLCSGSYTAYSIGDEAVPRDACPLTKAVMGFVETETLPIYKNCVLMAVPVTCDCKKKLAGLLSEYMPTAVLQIPSDKVSDDGLNRYLEELYRFLHELERVTGNTVTRQSLSEGINKIGKAQYEMSRFTEYRKHTPALLYGTHTMAVMNAYSYLATDEWADLMAELNKELEERKRKNIFAEKEKNPRIMITGSPIAFPNMKIPLLIEETGGILAADETCMGERSIYDPTVVTDKSFEGMMRALANRYIRPCTCPVFSDNSQRLYRIKQMIKTHQIEGVIYHVLRGCLVYDYEYTIIEEELEKLDIPVIRVESDYNEEDVEQLRVRIEAFIELIKLKNLKNSKKG
ncbi:MAG: 2-hydroxyacyl-CoA dehydratase family protein [Clostridiales bacterium]|nr:2-hydroxyacyl-CoA dehydratase family protein [Clostridiales bacterium]